MACVTNTVMTRQHDYARVDVKCGYSYPGECHKLSLSSRQSGQ